MQLLPVWGKLSKRSTNDSRDTVKFPISLDQLNTIFLYQKNKFP